MKFNSLKTKLSLSYVFISLLIIFLVSILSNFFLEKQFREYITSKQERRNIDISTQIAHQYLPDETWNLSGVESIGLYALSEGLIVKITDNNNTIVWDAIEHNEGLCVQMLDEIAQNMEGRYPYWNGGYVEVSYELKSEGNDFGNVSIGYYGPFFFDDNEMAFINTLNYSLIGIGLLSLLIAIIIGIIMSNKISKPITNATVAAKRIARGNYTEQIQESKTADELVQLTNTINYLANNLQRHQLMQKQITEDVAHELRTPLTTLQTHVEAMLDKVWDVDYNRLSKLHDEIIRLIKISKDLEKLSIFENEATVLKKSEFELNALVEEVVLHFDKTFKDKNLKLTLNLENENYILADKDKIHQVLINLISNSIKFTDNYDEITINVNSHKGEIALTIKDTGMGIKSCDIPFIFDRFYRTDSSRSRATGGSGIGLAIVKAIVNAHNGDISAESEISKGTTIKIILPNGYDE